MILHIASPEFPMADDMKPNDSPAKKIMGWVGTTSALIGLSASILGGVRWFENRHAQQAELAAKMAVAQKQASVGDYLASVRSYDAILTDHPLNPSALQQQLSVTMTWVENFEVTGADNQSIDATAAAELDQIFQILDAGLSRTKGVEAADVQAHLGWAHWLNQHIAEREFGHVAEQNLRAALQVDPTNVYANAMLGNWMLQNGGDRTEAVNHFRTAVATGKVRPFVRRFEIGGLSHDEGPLLPELFRTANEMRKDGEPLDDLSRSRVLYYCLNPPFTEEETLSAVLTSVAEDDAWKTYQWLVAGLEPKRPQTTSDYIHATLLRVSGHKSEALAVYRTLLHNDNSYGRIAELAGKQIADLTKN